MELSSALSLRLKDPPSTDEVTADMAVDLTYADATQLAEWIANGTVSSVQVASAHLHRIAAIDGKLNAIVTLNDNILDEAEAADQAIQAGRLLGPLHGVPFTVKDSIDTAHVQTQRGSPIFSGRLPEEDASSVDWMGAAGAILLAKTNLPEFSYSTESDNLLSGRTNNPWKLDRTPGGSSGGESAAIAAGLSPIGLGTDLAISVRGPAAQTGIMALKPTHGKIPMTGVWPRESRRFWHVGPMARSVRDLKLALSILSGPDGDDRLSDTVPAFEHRLDMSTKKDLRVGCLIRPGFGPIQPQVAAVVEAAARSLASDGCIVQQVTIPALERDPPLDIFLKLHVNEMKPVFERATKGQSEENIGLIARFMLDTPETPQQDFVEAEQAAERLKVAFAEYFQQYDALLCPVLPLPAHEHGLKSVLVEGEEIDGIKIMAVTVPFNVTGLPAISLPFGLSEEGLPIGVQLVGAWNAEATILELAARLESKSPMRGKRPEI